MAKSNGGDMPMKGKMPTSGSGKHPMNPNAKMPGNMADAMAQMMSSGPRKSKGRK